MRRIAARPTYPPVPPHEMPPARTVIVAGPRRVLPARQRRGRPGPPRRDAAARLDGHRRPQLARRLRRRWSTAGYRVLAIDHRGHGRGLRPLAPFRLADCAADAAAVLRELGVAPAIVVGYSMGGDDRPADRPRPPRRGQRARAQRHLPSTSRTPRRASCGAWMGVVGVALGLAPRPFWRAGFRSAEIRLDRAHGLVAVGADAPRGPRRRRGRPRARPLRLAPLAGVGRRAPAAMVLTSRDRCVSPRKQRELAAGDRRDVFEVADRPPRGHRPRPTTYNPALLAGAGGGDGAAERVRRRLTARRSDTLRRRCAAPAS